MNKALVTGCTGFIGQILVQRLLENGIAVRGLVRTTRLRQSWAEAVEQVDGDLVSKDTLTNISSGCDTIFHCAGYAHTRLPDHVASDSLHHQVTVDGTRFLLAEAQRSGVESFVFLSSIKATGENSTRCLTEHEDASPTDYYGESRLRAERLVLEAGQKTGMHVCNLRPALVYGSGVKGNLFNMMNAIAHRRFPPIPETGNERSMVHVHDLVDVMMQVAVKKEANDQTWHVTDGQAYSTRQIYDWMREALELRPARMSVPVSSLKLAGMLGSFFERVGHRSLPINKSIVAKLLDSACYSNQSLCDGIGFKPMHNLQAAMPEMVRAWKTAVQK